MKIATEDDARRLAYGRELLARERQKRKAAAELRDAVRRARPYMGTREILSSVGLVLDEAPAYSARRVS